MMRAAHPFENPPMPTRGALARFAEALRVRGTPTVAEARERIRAQPGFYASMAPALRKELDGMEEPVISGFAGAG